MNFNPLKTDPYDKLVWIRLNNLPMEYLTKEALENINKSLGTLMDIDADITQGDSYIYVRLHVAAVRRIPEYIKLRAHGKDWIQLVEVEEEKFYCSNCDRRNHSTIICKVPKKRKECNPKHRATPEDQGNFLCPGHNNL
ncbi:hypothetical protein SUGI_0809320 [Cryptomeria japonica]|nr:hypothetical protein SUGI_0809320 [Cryptomeria japonica]